MIMGIPDVILMIRIIIQFVRGLELLPDRWTAVLEECIDWVLILPVDLEVDIDHDKSKHAEHTLLTSDLANISKLGTKSSPGLTCFKTA